MDNLFINLSGMGSHGGTVGNTSPKEHTGTDSNQKSFLSILTSVISGSDSQESLLIKLKEIHESGEPGLAYVMSSISNMLLSMMAPNTSSIVLEDAGQKISEMTENEKGLETLKDTATQKEIEGPGSLHKQMNYSVLQEILANMKSGTSDQIEKGLVKESKTETEQVKAFQEEMVKLLSSLHSKYEPTIDSGKTPFSDRLGNIPVQNAVLMNQQALLKEKHNDESEVIQTQNTLVATEILTKEILDKNALLLRAILVNGGKINKDNSNNPEDNNKGIDTLFNTDEKLARNTMNKPFTAEQGLNDSGSDTPNDEAHTLILNAAKKYKEHVSGADELKINNQSEITGAPPQKPASEVPQGELLKSNILQVKDNNMTFEKGSFTSFVTNRIEKIVEQFSNRSSQMDMVVRLKLDDTETLLVGLRHEGQKVIVDVKASNDGLANLLQAHKDEIARHLEDKNIFTSIFVQPDGERNFQRKGQRENNKEDRKQEANTSFVNILEATA